ncbi:MAG: tRNA dihydrouridine synthase DusB [Desulfobacteraceae bacterium 4484_190.1]|nr:MAG: tRNA dihydrouridine synthase DusB [Desulfobacteraceae bacterium 4484_190.1]
MLKIGSLILKNRLIMAPMAGITNLPFRLIVKKYGVGLVTTEMISARGLTLAQKKTLEYLKSDPGEKPLAVQIFGSEPSVMSDAAVIAVEAGASIVDINMGCPARKVLKIGAGGALLQTPERIKKIVSAVKEVCHVPLTVKIRAGWSSDKPVALEIARIIEDCGADAITIHPRYITQGFSGTADWKIIAEVKRELKIPCIGSGDISTPALAFEMIRETACDGVMIGRGAIGNPWIFKQILDLEKGLKIERPGLDELRDLIMEHFRFLSLLKGEDRAARMMRGLLISYTKGLACSSNFRGNISSIKDLDTLILYLDHYFSLLKETGLYN